MNIEYEITFPNINKEEMRKKLETIGAECIRSEYLQQRVNFDIPGPEQKEKEWIRLRTDEQKTTLAYKSLHTKEGKNELEFDVSSFDTAKEFMQRSGAIIKNEQSNRREIWKYDNITIRINEWPFLEPFMDIKSNNEIFIKNILDKLNLNWDDGIFDNVVYLYVKKYKISHSKLNNQTPYLVFDMKNPFLES